MASRYGPIATGRADARGVARCRHLHEPQLDDDASAVLLAISVRAAAHASTCAGVAAARSPSSCASACTTAAWHATRGTITRALHASRDGPMDERRRARWGGARPIGTAARDGQSLASASLVEGEGFEPSNDL